MLLTFTKKVRISMFQLPLIKLSAKISVDILLLNNTLADQDACKSRECVFRGKQDKKTLLDAIF